MRSIIKYKKGFIATTSVLVLSSGVLAFSLATFASAYMYSDSVYRREVRIQASLNLEACLDASLIISESMSVIDTDINIRQFGCQAHITKTAHSVSIKAQAVLGGVGSKGERSIGF